MRASILPLSVVIICPAYAAESRIVSGRVVDEEGRAIANASIRVYKSIPAVTDTEGRFSFDAGSSKSVPFSAVATPDTQSSPGTNQPSP